MSNKKYNPLRDAAARITLACLSGLLVAASFPPIDLWMCMLFAWIPLFFSIDKLPARKAFYLGYLQGALAFGITLSWLYNIFGLFAFALIMIMAFFTAAFCCLYNVIINNLKSLPLKILSAGVIWTSLEYYRSELFFLRFTWITPGMALGPTHLTPFIGIYGMSFIVIIISAMLYSKRCRKPGVLFALVLAILTAIGMPVIDPSPDAIKVAAVQDESMALHCYIQRTEALKDEKVDLIVWPEYAVRYDLIKESPDEFKELQSLIKELNCTLLFGTQTKLGGDSKYNTALALDGDNVLGKYHKNRPVHFFDDGLPGPFLDPIVFPVGKAGTPICFDYDYTSIMRKMALKGAQFYAIPSCDPMQWTERQHNQHSSLLPIRAAENGKWVVCAATSGISAIIDPHGNIHEFLEPMTDGVITGLLDLNNNITFYSRIGWLLPYICMGLTILLLIFVMYEHLPVLISALPAIAIYAVIITSMHILHNGWIAILGYHLIMCLFLTVKRQWGQAKELTRGWNNTIGVGMAVGCLLAGPTIYFLWPYIQTVDMGSRLDFLNLGGNKLIFFAIYYVIANPWLEELFWRGWHCKQVKEPMISDILFAGYHVVVLLLFITPAWSVFAFTVLFFTARIWRMLATKYNGLLIPSIAHLLADISVIVAAFALK